MTDGHELTPEDVQEILRLIDDAGIEELDLETERFTVRVRRGERAEVEPTPDTAAQSGRVDVTAPTVGTFYRASAPGQPPFVDVGSRVEPDTVVCILEVMKLMSSVPAGASGTIAEICVENGRAVQYGDVLFRVQP